VYIIASPTRTIYTGVTNNLERRRWEHRERINPGFASEHGCDRLVHAETFEHPRCDHPREGNQGVAAIEEVRVDRTGKCGVEGLERRLVATSSSDGETFLMATCPSFVGMTL